MSINLTNTINTIKNTCQTSYVHIQLSCQRISQQIQPIFAKFCTNFQAQYPQIFLFVSKSINLSKGLGARIQTAYNNVFKNLPVQPPVQPQLSLQNLKQRYPQDADLNKISNFLNANNFSSIAINALFASLSDAGKNNLDFMKLLFPDKVNLIHLSLLDNLKEDKDFMSYVLANTKETFPGVQILQNAGPNLKKNKDFVLEVVKITGCALSEADDSLKQDEEVCLAAINQDWEAIMNAKPSPCDNFILAQNACQLGGRNALKYIDSSLHQTLIRLMRDTQNDN